MSARMSLGQMDRTCATEGHKRSMKVGLVGEMKKLEQVMMMMMSVTPPPPSLAAVIIVCKSLRAAHYMNSENQPINCRL